MRGMGHGREKKYVQNVSLKMCWEENNGRYKCTWKYNIKMSLKTGFNGLL
jgi:hypothetical protein